MSTRRPLLHGLTVTLACLAAACQPMAAKKGLLEQEVAGSRLSSRKLRVLVTDYVPRFSGQVEETADQILARTNDSEIRRQALLWKTNGIAACFRAAARPDALAAFLDLWILNRQMTHLFEGPAERPLLGPWQGLALETSRRLEQSLQQIHAILGRDLPYGADFVETFAREHPVTGLYFDRESLATSYIDSMPEKRREGLEVVGDLADELDDVKRLSALYADFLPKQARWQAELLLLAAAETGPVARSLEDLSVAAQAAGRVAQTAETASGLLERERQAAHEIVRQERTEALRDVDRMRVATLDDLRQERVAVVQALRDERVALSTALQDTAETSVRGIDQMLRERTAEVPQWCGQLIEHAYRRCLQLCLVGGAALVLCLLLWTLRVRPERQAGQIPQGHVPGTSSSAARPRFQTTRSAA